MAVFAASAPRVPYSIDLHRVVDHELGRRQRIDALGIPPRRTHRIAHGGKVHDAGHAGEVLQDDAGGGEGDLVRGAGGRIPLEQRLDIARA